MMKLTAKADILFDGKKVKKGLVFEANEDQAALLIEYGWAEKIEEPKVRKRKKD